MAGLLRDIASSGSGERVSVGDITSALGQAGLGGAILVPSLIALSPATAIFGVATVCGIAIAVIATQIMLNRKKLWLPRWMCRLRVRRTALVWLRNRLERPFVWLERRSSQRLTWLMRTPMGYVPGILSFLVGASMPFLELVPLSATTGGGAVTLMVLGLLLDDGLLVLGGILAAVCVALLVIGIGSGLSGLIL
ncbi:exopolysaccharide biosynthesis protein [uncultured Jannaschia sp.]|uniref:exopolysaccharide biosynthesis protein n=1 Tax=uncultured Jannaschia sp. TaxID=293347 RepID=UPI002615EE91|nr:exopolysaccharide biosynthesis protein [uncultured Jannaschia sp.]